MGLSRPALGSITVDPTTVSPDNSAALATADAKSASAKNEPSLELSPLLRFELQLVSELSVTLAHEATIEPVEGTGKKLGQDWTVCGTSR